MSPAKVRMIAAAVGAVASLAAIIVLVMQGPPSDRSTPTAQSGTPSPEAVSYPTTDNALSPRPTRERPSIARPGVDGVSTITSELSARQWDLKRIDGSEVAGEVGIPRAFAEALGIGQGPVWVHVVAAWCLPCLWELDGFFASAKTAHAAGGRVVAAVIDAKEGTPEAARAGLEAIVAGRAQLPDIVAVTTPKGLVPVADTERHVNALVDMLVGDAPGLREQGIPLSVVFDACGAPRLIVQNRHDAATFRLLEETLPKLSKTCTKP